MTDGVPADPGSLDHRLEPLPNRMLVASVAR